ncbi:synaptosomal-associated protein 29-like [Eucyclogobius newberryi]|uniref:synaptosomal-associated protein 29-like n=1 Tax=Eucyclogobius newberryi TaxID=166745 RepID=UPI003B5BE51E
MAYPRTCNPFADDANDEDFRPKKCRGFDDNNLGDSKVNDAESRQKHLEQEVICTAKSAVESSRRSLSLIYDSENMGIQTAEISFPPELIRQGKVLKNTDDMLDNIDQDLNINQKHIKSMKSVWGAFVNYFKGKPDKKPLPERPRLYQANDGLQNALSSTRSHENKYQARHLNLRKLDTGEFGAASSGDDSSYGQNGDLADKILREAHQTLDDNLDEMTDALQRLKGLGLGLQSELDLQNASLDSLLNKADKMDLKLHYTENQLKRLK